MIDVIQQVDFLFDRDDSTDLRLGEPIGGFRDHGHHLLLLQPRERLEKPSAPEPGEPGSQLRLENHDQGEGTVREHLREKVRNQTELQRLRGDVNRHEQDEPDQDLECSRPGVHQQHPVEQVGDDEDLGQVHPVQPQKAEIIEQRLHQRSA
ncbi:MAG: hypothetical protein P8125_08490 [Gemmatimonadota bacterium]